MLPYREQFGQWMDRAAQGDDSAFEALALAVQDRLFRFALAHGLKRADAADAVQESLMRAFRARQTWRPGGNVTGWLYGIAMNVVREQHRRRAHGAVDGIDLEHVAGGEAPGPGATERAERQTQLASALAALPPRQQEAVACRYLMDMSLKETADVMGCAEGTVKAAVFAGLENMRKHLHGVLA